MTLTIQEAQNLLGKVFADTLPAGSSVIVSPGITSAATGPEVTLSLNTFHQMLEIVVGNPSNKIQAIKFYRDATSVGLAEAKQYVEDLMAKSRP